MDKAVNGIFLCLFIIFPITNGCGTSDSPTTYVLENKYMYVQNLHITSPNYPEPYPKDDACYWLVQEVTGSKLKYGFTGQFRLESHDQCQYDNVTLYDSSNTTNVIESYCGSSPPGPGITTGSYLYISFKSDGRATYPGFKLEITSTACGTSNSPITVAVNYQHIRSITSPNYPGDYPDNKSCYWLVRATAPDFKVKYTFIDKFQLETEDQCQYDSVTLYDSSNTTNIIGSYCGWHRPSPNPGTTTGRYLLVSFKSDGRAMYAGFNLEITAEYNVLDTREESKSLKTYVLERGESVFISTPMHPNLFYENNLTFNWLVMTTTPDCKLQYSFFGNTFNIEAGDQCQYDNVTLYDSSTTTNIIGSYCGRTTPNPGRTTGRYLYVSFKSDDGEIEEYRGFKLEIFSKCYECGTADSPITYVLDPGHTLNITSPNFPAYYPNNEMCYWLVQTAPDSILKYRFIDDFEIESGYYANQCPDNVTLYDSSNTTNVIGSYCGSSPPNPGTTTGRYLYVSFKSDGSGMYLNSGFILEITPK